MIRKSLQKALVCIIRLMSCEVLKVVLECHVR